MKIDIISGFLGAGKTTFIKRLLNTDLKNEKVVLIENEYGEISVDTDLLSDTKIEIKELSQGCICCSLAGDFSKSLKEIITKFNPDRIIIEPSGVGKLTDIVAAVNDAGYKDNINSLVCMVDAKKAKMYDKNFGEFFIDQIKSAHTVILSRTDVSKEDTVNQALEIIRKHNEHAVVVTTPINDLSDEELLKAYEGFDINLNDFDLDDEDECDDPNCECHHHHHADEVFNSIGIETVKKYDISALKDLLDRMSKGEFGTIVRAKGIIQGTDAKWYQFNLTPEEVEFKDNKAIPMGKIVVIGSHIDSDSIKKLF
jgi:G3E family GTPase